MLNNNAGIGAGRIGSQQRQLSQDGYELRFAVNHLAPFLLTHLLIPTLLGNGLARVVNVASAAQQAIVRWCGRASGRLKGDVEEGIRSELFVATAPEIEGIRGAYFDRTHRARAHDQAYDAQARRHLWRPSEELTGFAG